jgi:hypothetical protein
MMGLDFWSFAESTPIPGTLMSSRQAVFDLTNTRIALSKTAICSRSCRQATSIGRLPKIILGVRFTDGIEVVKPKAQAAAA